MRCKGLQPGWSCHLAWSDLVQKGVVHDLHVPMHHSKVVLVDYYQRVKHSICSYLARQNHLCVCLTPAHIHCALVNACTDALVRDLPTTAGPGAVNVFKPELTVNRSKASKDVLGFAGKRGTHHRKGVLNVGQSRTAQVAQITAAGLLLWCSNFDFLAIHAAGISSSQSWPGKRTFAEKIALRDLT